MASIYQPPTQDSAQYTLNTQMGASDTSLTLNQSVTGIVQAPGVGWVDRVDSSGNKTPTVREYFSFTGVSGSQLTGITRGIAGSTAQVHQVGAIVEFGPDVVQQQGIYDTLSVEHSNALGAAGVHASLISLTIVKTQNLQVLNSANISGASYQAFPVRAVWVMPGLISGASTGVGKPLVMLDTGNWQSFTAMTRTGVSGASMVFQVNKNGAAIFTGTTPTIPGAGGTYISTASITTKSFVPGDVFTVDVTAFSGGFTNDITVEGFAR